MHCNFLFIIVILLLNCECLHNNESTKYTDFYWGNRDDVVCGFYNSGCDSGSLQDETGTDAYIKGECFQRYCRSRLGNYTIDWTFNATMHDDSWHVHIELWRVILKLKKLKWWSLIILCSILVCSADGATPDMPGKSSLSGFRLCVEGPASHYPLWIPVYFASNMVQFIDSNFFWKLNVFCLIWQMRVINLFSDSNSYDNKTCPDTMKISEDQYDTTVCDNILCVAQCSGKSDCSTYSTWKIDTSRSVLLFLSFSVPFICKRQQYCDNGEQTLKKAFLSKILWRISTSNFPWHGTVDQKQEDTLGAFNFLCCFPEGNIFVNIVPQWLWVSPLHRVRWVWLGGWNWLDWFGNHHFWLVRKNIKNKFGDHLYKLTPAGKCDKF